MKTKLVGCIAFALITLTGCQTLNNFIGNNRMHKAYAVAQKKLSDPEFLKIIETSAGALVVDGIHGQVISQELNSEISLTSNTKKKTAEFGINYKPTMERFIEHESGQQVATLQSKYMNLLFDQVLAYIEDYPNSALTLNIEINGYATASKIHSKGIPALNGCNFSRVDTHFIESGKKHRYTINIKQGEFITDNKVLALSRACVAYNLAQQHRINDSGQAFELNYNLFGQVGTIKGVKISVFVHSPY